MRFKGAGVGVLVAVVVAGPGAAGAGAGAADLRIVALPGAATTGYATPQTVIKKGGTLSFLNLDVAAHDVVSVNRDGSGQPVFKSALIGIGKRTPVAGVSTLPVGNYGFFCSLHTNMKGKLKVIK